MHVLPACLPAGRLGGSRGVLRKGGLLMVTSTWDWSEKVADKQLWLGGTRDAAGAAIRCVWSCGGCRCAWMGVEEQPAGRCSACWPQCMPELRAAWQGLGGQS